MKQRRSPTRRSHNGLSYLIEDVSNLCYLRDDFWDPDFTSTAGLTDRQSAWSFFSGVMEGSAEWVRPSRDYLQAAFRACAASIILSDVATLLVVQESEDAATSDQCTSHTRLVFPRPVMGDDEDEPLYRGGPRDSIAGKFTVQLPTPRRRLVSKSLDFLSRQPALGIGMPPRSLQSIKGFDLQLYRQKLDMEFARATAPIGWDGRDIYLQRATTGYKTYRRLVFRRFQVEILDSMLAQLNFALSRSEWFGGVTLQIKLPNAHSTSWIDSQIDRFSAGDIGCDDVFNLLVPR